MVWKAVPDLCLAASVLVEVDGGQSDKEEAHVDILEDIKSNKKVEKSENKQSQDHSSQR